MKKLQFKKTVQKPLQKAQKQNDQKHVSDMGIGFRVVDMHANQLESN